MRAIRMVAACVLALSLLSGCTGITAPENPSFSIKAKDASKALDEMAQAPRPLQRPLVILAGYGDPGLGPWLLDQRLSHYVQTRGKDGRSLTIHAAFLFNTSMEGCRRRVVQAVEDAFPSDDPSQTTEVDVIGISLGGAVARLAAMPQAEANTSTQPASAQKRLRIARLFTISSPHRGAIQASEWPAMNSMVTDLRVGSEFMKRFDQSIPTIDYKLYPYVRLGDSTVGVDNAAPTGRAPYWLPNLPYQIAHGQAWTDPRILADILRRLRDEPPLATDPPAPLPDTANAAAEPARHS